MQNEIIVNAEAGETRVALLERSVFSELHIERARTRSVVGSVVKGRVSRVLPGMQAAFVDIGLDKAAFLYVGDYFENTRDPDAENGGGKPGRPRRGRNGRNVPKIESVLQEGQEIVVQVAKEPIGSKGARITSNISIPGRHLVLTPWARRVGVSRRIGSDRERRRLREIVDRLKTDDLGFIIRTAGDGVREADLEADIRYLTSVWNRIQEHNRSQESPSVLYSEPDLPLRMIRDFANPETKRITIDSQEVYDRIRDFVEQYVADPRPKIEHYSGKDPIFDDFGLEAQILSNLEKKVWLKSGGHLVIDQSEALTAIDVNTGRYIGKRDLEETVFRTNLEAVKEVVYQLRFRNIGGLIIIDLIDMDSGENRERVYRALQDAIRQDKARTNILKISELGLVEMTRKRTRENLVQTLCEPCAYCEGRGYILSRESVSFRVLREIRKDLPRFCGRHIAIRVSTQVAEELLTTGREALSELGEELGREIEVRSVPGLHQEQFEVMALDEGEPVELGLQWLSSARPEPEADETPGDGRKRTRRRGRGRGRGGRGAEAEETDAEEESTPAKEGEATEEGEAAEEVEAAEEGVASEETAEAPGASRRAPAAEPDARPLAQEEPADDVTPPYGEDPDRPQTPAEAFAAAEAAAARARARRAAKAEAAEALEEPTSPKGATGPPAEAAPESQTAEPAASQAIDEEAESRILPPSAKFEE